VNHGLYIHIPFCARKCPYCGFYSVTDRTCLDAYLKSLLTEIKSLEGNSFDTVYTGGGAPSLLGAELPVLLEKIVSLTGFCGAEFTVEVNPESVTKELMSDLSGLPVSRISVGAQSADDSVLRLLERIHTSERIFAAYDIIRSNTGCDINLDLMYDIPSVDAQTVKRSVKKFIALGPEHISAYSYSPDTGYLTDKASDDSYQTEMVTGILEDAGYMRYEVSNFSIPGHESIHNMKYWRMQPYYGVGAGAHSMVVREGRRVRYSHLPDIETYIADPLEKADVEMYDCKTAALESVVFGLRCVEGVDLLEITEKFGAITNELTDKINVLAGEGLLKCAGNRIKASKKGFLLLDSVMSYLW
jgi:oxygen-independent coproporphyrinogen-3 oxidase